MILTAMTTPRSAKAVPSLAGWKSFPFRRAEYTILGGMAPRSKVRPEGQGAKRGASTAPADCPLPLDELHFPASTLKCLNEFAPPVQPERRLPVVHQSARHPSDFEESITEILTRFATGLTSETDTNIRLSLQEIAEFVGVDYAHLIRTSADRTHWSLTHEWCSPIAPSQLGLHQQVPMGTWDWMEKILLAGERLRINCLDEIPADFGHVRDLLETVGFKSTLQIPLRRPGGEVSGCIALSSLVREVTWTAADVARLQSVGEAIANSIERAQVVDELQQIERRFQSTFEQAPFGILNLKGDGRVLEANQRFCDLLGYAHDEVLGRYCWEFTHPEDRDATQHLYARLRENRQLPQVLEKRYRRKDGSVVWANLSLSVLPSKSPQDEVFTAIIQDISERKEAEEQQLRRALLMAASLDGVWEWESASNRIQYSERFAELLGYTFGEIPPNLSFFRGILHPEERGLIQMTIDQHFIDGIPYDLECRLQNRNGAYRWYRTRGKAHRGRDGRVTWVAVSLQDIHEQKTAEQELRNALAEIERLSDRLQAENTYLQEEISRSLGFDDIVGSSKPLRNVLSQIEHVARTDASVLLLGETGTGKELFARAIHDRSSRKPRPLVKVNLAALPASLIESELFGHVKGAFTGAVANKVGRFELADGGTLFLDEIGELSLELQAKLLRVLQEGEFEKIGSNQTRRVDVRIVAATNRDLRGAIELNAFRADLYYRLAVFPIDVPPLRLRRDDIPLLVWHFIAKKQVRLGKKIARIPDRTLQALVDYDWPGNIRELENVIERAMILSSDQELELSETLSRGSLPADKGQANLGTQPRTHKDLDRAEILAALDACSWKIKGSGNAAERLGLKPSTLRYRMKTLGIHRPE